MLIAHCIRPRLFSNFGLASHFLVTCSMSCTNSYRSFLLNSSNTHLKHVAQISSVILSNNSLLEFNVPAISSSVPASSQCLHIVKRFMAKNKDRKKEKKTDKPKVILDDEDMEKVMEYEEFQLEIDSIINELKSDLKLNYNIRLNPRLIESLQISYDGINVMLGDIVTISRKQQELVLNLSATPSAVKATLNAILDSGMNLNPQQDGNVIYIRMPKVTTEHRQALVKSVKSAGQKVKDKIKDRNFQKKFYHKVDKKLSQDLVNDVNANISFYIKQKFAEIDQIVNQKVESLLSN